MTNCKTRYPILLLHGLNCRDTRPIFYWGRVPRILEAHGAKVYLGGQDAWGTVADNGRVLKARVEDILAAEGCGKVNIIAHSKGGLEARRLISSLGMAGQVATLTTVCTPHRGSRTAEVWTTRRRWACRLAAPVMNAVWRLLGDRAPDFLTVLHELTPQAMEDFNREHPNSPLVFYQSYGAALGRPAGEGLLARVQMWFCRADGVTDGLVSPASAIWGEDRGVLDRVSHQDVVDSRKKDLAHFSPGDFYVRMVRELAERGF